MQGADAGSADREPPEEELPFEEALRRLEQAVAGLEGAELTLDEALATFEEGVRMARICSRRLQQAEARLYMLVQRDGADQAVPFEPPPLRSGPGLGGDSPGIPSGGGPGG